MKTVNPFFLVTAAASWMLTACDQDLPRASQQTDATAEQPYDDQLAATRDAYERQAAEMEARSAQLAQQLADLERSVKDQENKQLRDRLESVRAENEKLRGDAAAARRKSDEFEARMVRAPEPAEDYSVFYEELNPHGRWMEVEGYGYAWQPRQATSASWRPYLDGRWVWSEHGWAWDSNEPFGWACYHYGRWMRLSRFGWVWVPGREWAPAWVSWRTGPDAVGWAPLPPERRRTVSHRVSHSSDLTYDLGPSSYTFINTQHFNRPSYTAAQMPQPNVTQIFQQTVNVTNIVQSSQTTNVYVQRGGPRRDWIERFVRARIPEARVEVVRQSGRDFRSSIERQRSAQQPHLTVLQLPDRPSKTRIRPAKVEERVEKPAVVDGWAGVSPERRTVLREVVERQAREAPPATASTPPAPSDTPAPMPPAKPEPDPAPAAPTASRQPPPDTPTATRPTERAPRPEVRPGAPGIRTGRQSRPEVTERPAAPQPPTTTAPRTSTGSLPGSVPTPGSQPPAETTPAPAPAPAPAPMPAAPDRAVTGTARGSSIPAPAATPAETPPPAAVPAPMPAAAAPDSSVGQDGKSSTAPSATDPVRPPASAPPQKPQAPGKFKTSRGAQPPAVPTTKGRGAAPSERTSRVPPGMTRKGDAAEEARAEAARQAEELKQKEMEAAAKAKEAAEHEAAMKARAEAEAKQKAAAEKAREEAMQKQKEMEAAKKAEEEARMKEETAKKAEEEAAAKKVKEEEAARKQKEGEVVPKPGEQPNKKQGETAPEAADSPAAPETKPAYQPGRPLPKKFRKG